jgi:hypothetical protein
MDEIKIVTDNKPRELKCFMDLSERERADFDYIKDAEFYDQRFVRYKGHWYDVNDTQRICAEPYARHMFDFCVNPDHPFAKWNCITSETFFSGVLFRWGKEYAHVVVGSYCC